MRLGKDLLALDLYALLELTPAATPLDIRRAYRRLARQSHPDLNPHDRRALERMTTLNRAAGVLLDPARRAHYDQARARTVGRTTTPRSRSSSSEPLEWEPAPRPATGRLSRELRSWIAHVHPWPSRACGAFDSALRGWPAERHGTFFVVAILLAVGLIAHARPRSLSFWCEPDCPPPPVVVWRT
ncbi:MAG: J domain-containing protein [Polyangiaceae bacterium]|nr:J domain-containing protein [Polyangiaceae bacterium]